MKKYYLILSFVFMVCFALPVHAEKIWSPERLYTGFERATHEARQRGGVITVQGPVAKVVNDDAGNSVLVLGDENAYTLWCYMADGQKMAGLKKGQKKTIRGRAARKIPSYEAVQMHNCMFQ